MIGKITDTDTGQERKTKKQNNPESFSRSGDFKRHTILAKMSVFTILLEKTGLYVMIDTGQLKS